MSEELDILKIVAENPSISQRKISEQTGISLGQVNFLLKKCVKKGLIKIEGQTSKSLKYNLTPKGIAEKATLTLAYIKISYSAVIALTDKIRTLGQEEINVGNRIIVYGEHDEMLEIVKLALNGIHLPWDLWEEYILGSEKDKNFKEEYKQIVFCWDANCKAEIENYPVRVINILE